MSRRKKHLLPWCSAKVDGDEKRFAQLGNSYFFSPAVQSLSYPARALYECMIVESGGKKQFEFPASSMRKYGFHRSTATEKIAELIESGFIVCVSSGKNVRQPSVYEFSNKWKLRGSS